MGKNAGEWTGRVEISKEEMPDSKRSMYGYILSYPRAAAAKVVIVVVVVVLAVVVVVTAVVVDIAKATRVSGSTALWITSVGERLHVLYSY